jgi:hypothetical protein
MYPNMAVSDVKAAQGQASPPEKAITRVCLGEARSRPAQAKPRGIGHRMQRRLLDQIPKSVVRLATVKGLIERLRNELRLGRTHNQTNPRKFSESTS